MLSTDALAGESVLPTATNRFRVGVRVSVSLPLSGYGACLLKGLVFIRPIIAFAGGKGSRGMRADMRSARGFRVCGRARN